MMGKLKKIISLTQTKTAKNTYIVFIGNSIAGLIGMVLMIILSRILGPAGFGAFSVSFALFGLLAKFADLGFNFAMVKDISESRARKEKGEIIKIFETVFFSKVVISLVIACLGFFLIDFVSVKLLRSSFTITGNRYVALFFFFFVFYDIVRVYFQANKRFLESTLVYITANLFKLIMVLVLLLLLPGFKDYILLYILAPFLAALIFFRRTKIKLRLKLHKQVFKKLIKFSSWMGVSVIFAAIGENLNVFMLSSNLSAFQTGIYSAAEKFILPFYIFAGALGTVLISRTSEFLELSHIKSFIKKVAVVQVLFLLLVIVVFPFSSLLPFLLGDKYLASVPVLQILIIAGFFSLATTPLNSIFYPMNKSVIFAVDSVIKVALIFILNQRFLLKFGARGAAFSLLIANAAVFLINYLFLFYQLKKREIK